MLLLLVWAPCLQAATLTVTTSADQLDVPAGALLSLREAIRDATDGDTIDFGAGLNGNTLVLSLDELEISAKDLHISAASLSQGITLTSFVVDLTKLLVIRGGSAVTIANISFLNGSTTNNGGALCISGGSDVELLNCNLEGNSAAGNGGAIFNQDSSLFISNCTLIANASRLGSGGALYSSGNSSTVTVTRSSIRKNRCAEYGGGICNEGGTNCDIFDSSVVANRARRGGGIYAENVLLRTARVDVSANTAVEYGGGVYLGASDNMTLRNSTLADNRALEGAGLYCSKASTPTLNLCTVARNHALLRGAGIFLDAADLTLRNSVVAGNTGRRGNDIYDAEGSLGLPGNNFVGDNTSVESELPVGAPNGNGDYAGSSTAPLDPVLSARGNYGGRSACMLPLENSLLIDNAGTSAFTVDQRSFVRPSGIGIDIGAVECSSSVTVTTESDEDNGALGLGAGDSLREVLSYGLGVAKRVTFDPSLNGDSIDASSEIDITGGYAFIDASSLGSGITIEGNLSSRLFHVSGSATASFHKVRFNRGFAGFEGGAIFNQQSSLTLDACSFSSCGVDTGIGLRKGGAIMSDEACLVVDGCTFVSNRISGTGSLNQGGAIRISEGMADIRHSTFTENAVALGLTGGGGAILTALAEVLVDGCIFFDNTAGGVADVHGGAVSASSGNVCMNRTTISENLAFASDKPAQGGGVYSSQTDMRIENSTLEGNRATSNFGASHGGAIHHAFNIDLIVKNCTIEGNDAAFGGGISFTNADATLRHVTINKNFGESGGGGVYIAGHSTSTINFENCLVAGNTTVLPFNGADIEKKNSVATLNAIGANLVGNNTTVTNEFPTGPLIGTLLSPVDPLLDDLDYYGGPTRTMLLKVDSPAQDSGSVLLQPSICDQRGFRRDRGAGPDLGAYETGSPPGYDAWQRESIPAGSSNDLTADLEGDMILNGWEYGLRLGPTNVDVFPFVPVADTNGNYVIALPYQPLATDIVYVVESTVDLLSGFNEAIALDMQTYCVSTSVDNIETTLDPIADTLIFMESIAGGDTQNFFRLLLRYEPGP